MQVVPGFAPLAGGAGPPGPQGPAGPQGNPGVGVPAGGAAGNFLLKLSPTAYDTGWGTASDVAMILGLGSAAYASASSFAAASASLTALGSVTPAADTLAYYTGTTTAGSASLTSAGRTLIAAADAAAQRTALGLGTAAQATVGTSANQVPQLDSQALMPDGTVYAAATWTNRWRASDGDPTANGFAQAGTQNIAVASTTQAGVVCYSLTPPTNSGSAYIQAAWTAANSSWEMYAKVWVPDSATGTTQRLCLSYSPAATASGSRRIEIGFSSTACLIFSGSLLTSIVTCPDFTDQWVDLLVQCYQSADGSANSWWRISIGRLVIYSGQPPATLASTAGAGVGTFYIGRISASSQVTPFYIAELAIRTALNPAPPEYRFAQATWPL